MVDPLLYRKSTRGVNRDLFSQGYRGKRIACSTLINHSTMTLLARLRGLSTSRASALAGHEEDLKEIVGVGALPVAVRQHRVLHAPDVVTLRTQLRFRISLIA
jgi:hypothetical protein